MGDYELWFMCIITASAFFIGWFSPIHKIKLMGKKAGERLKGYYGRIGE